LVIDGFAPGAVVGDFRLQRPLGQGGTAAVWEATQLPMDRAVALKILSPSMSADVAFRARFERECATLAQLDHPHIIPAHHAGEFQGVLFLAMRLVQGPSLRELIEADSLNPRRTLDLLRPVAEALDAAHATGVIHRDISPQNILVEAGDHPYLADFGLTQRVADSTLTRPGEVPGSFNYVSPELISNQKATAASDIYSLGAVLFECLTGVVPYHRDFVAAVLYAHINDTPPRVTDHCPTLPRKLDRVFSRALAKRPRTRPKSATELVAAVEHTLDLDDRLVDGASRSPRRPPAAQQLPSGWAMPGSGRRSSPARRRTSIYAVSGVLALAGGLGFSLGRAPGDQEGRTALRTVRAGPAELAVPVAWRSPSKPFAIPGLSFSAQQSLQHDAPGDVLVAGVLGDAEGEGLLPPGFRARLDRTPSLQDPVRLGGAVAYRYENLAVRGLGNRLTLFVVPTSTGVLGIGCVASRATAKIFLASCEQAASTLRLDGARALALGADPAYGGVLARADTRLIAAREIASRLAHTASRAQQASLSGRLAAVHAAVARMLAEAKPGPDVAHRNALLVAALRDAARGYSAMSRAAVAAQTGAYEAARNGTRSALQQIQVQLNAVRDAGYA
jgi:hypothetical protein